MISRLPQKGLYHCTWLVGYLKRGCIILCHSIQHMLMTQPIVTKRYSASWIEWHRRLWLVGSLKRGCIRIQKNLSFTAVSRYRFFYSGVMTHIQKICTMVQICTMIPLSKMYRPFHRRRTRNGHRNAKRNPNRNHKTIVLGLFSFENLKRDVE